MVEKKVLSEIIKDQILDEILSGALKPGDRLVEIGLAKKYGVSQAPVREAIKSLQTLRLVQQEPYKGAVVRKYTKTDLEEFFVVRSSLEGLAGRIAARVCTKKDISELQQILNEMVDAAKSGNNELRMDLNNKFHKRLISASKNSLLIEISENLRLSTWSRITGSHSRMTPDAIALRHQTIIDMLKTRDEDGMEQAMIKHVKQSLDYFMLDQFPEIEDK